MLRKHSANFGAEWDTYLLGVLCAYCNTPHTSTGENPSYLLFGYDCHSLTEAALFSATSHEPVDISDYCKELVVMLSTARKMTAQANREG